MKESVTLIIHNGRIALLSAAFIVILILVQRGL